MNMKKTNLLITSTLSLLIFGCSGIKVTTDYEKKADFSQYKTFSFLGWQENSDKIMNDFDKKRMRDAFKNEFNSRNLKFEENRGSMAISLYVVVNKETSVTSYTNYHGGYGGRYRRGGYGWGGGSASTSYTEEDYLKGTLVMDVFDESSGDMIWQGIATSTVPEKPEKREKSIPKTISALMKQFPIKPVQ